MLVVRATAIDPSEAEELEQAGCDAVIVASADVAALTGDLPPQV